MCLLGQGHCWRHWGRELKGLFMDRKDLMTAIALATGISVAVAGPGASGGLSPPIEDPDGFEPASGNQGFTPATGSPEPGGRSFGGY